MGTTTSKSPLVDSNFASGIILERLSLSTLAPALRLANSVFPDDINSGERVNLAFRVSLLVNSDSKLKQMVGHLLLRVAGVSKLRYWAALDETTRQVIGVTGLYEKREDAHEVAWGGWMCVDPTYRGHGLGRKLAEFSIETARSEGKHWARLYTSTLPGEVAAQHLYDSLGFVIYRTEPIPGSAHYYLYRQLDLQASQ
jgi:GNAT superfamily N-acetyltransferase